MNNNNNYEDIGKINSQLRRADIQKRILIRNIYREYEFYLNLVRDLIYVSVEKGINEIYSHQLINDNLLNENEFYSLFEKKIGKIVYAKLPLLTVEQLKINETEKNKKNKINLNMTGSSSKIKLDQKERFKYEDGFQFVEPIQFQINEKISNTSEYYQAENHEKFVSLDLDNKTIIIIY